MAPVAGPEHPLTTHLAGARAEPVHRTTMGRIGDLQATLGVPRTDFGRRVAEPVAVTGLNQHDARPHRVEERRR